jgi:hypothetical protein
LQAVSQAAHYHTPLHNCLRGILNDETVFDRNALLHITEPSVAQLMDEKTPQLTGRGEIVSAVAIAQVAEMHCGLKGQIAKALAKADRMNSPVNLNDKIHFSDVLFFTTNVKNSAEKIGLGQWCQYYQDNAQTMFEMK